MRLFISHRGNLWGRNENRENDPEYVLLALSEGVDVEIDVWYVDGYIFLGHDEPRFIVEEDFLEDPRLWIHCKNIESMEYLSTKQCLNIFAHKDDIIITRDGFLWTAPGYPITPRSIAVMPELADGWDIDEAYGVCTDYPLKYKYHLQHKL